MIKRSRSGRFNILVLEHNHREIIWRSAELCIIHSSSSWLHNDSDSFTTKLQKFALQSRDTDRPQGPALPVPYCYRTHLVIGRVEEEDNYVSVIVRNEGETRNTPLKLHVVDIPSKASKRNSAFTSYLTYFILSALFAHCVFWLYERSAEPTIRWLYGAIKWAFSDAPLPLTLFNGEFTALCF